MHFHQIILKYLLEYREKYNPKFNFLVRQRASINDKKYLGGKFAHGLVFQGTDDYCFVAISDKSGGANATKSIGIVIKPIKENSFSAMLEIVFPGETNIALINFYRDLASKFQNINWDNKRERAYLHIGEFPENDPTILYNWLDDNFPIIRDTALESGIEKLIPNDARFQVLQEKLKLKLQEAKGNNKTLSNINSEIIPKNKKDNQKKMKGTNQILFGPPGTGKTYASKEIAVSIIDGNSIENIDKTVSKKEKRKLITDRYEQLYNAEQIVFTTFHQSMSYEDFIEGIKPIPPVSENSSINYKIEDGVFKSLCKKASETKSSSNFDDAYSKFVNDVTELGTIELKSLVQKKPFNVRINSNETAVAIPKTEIATEMGITKEMMREYIVNGVIKDWKTYTTSIGEYIKEKYNVTVENTDSRAKEYVIIIDEINRGNVSAIFGELITLLEPDKRLDETESLTIKLPYSKANFGVPSNLHIVGTMNTADKSVEAIDTALRRRFEFKEIMPNPSLLEQQIEGISLQELLETLNKRIEILLDRDHTIGHSYFIKLEQNDTLGLKNAFKNNIIPLLQEYFYGDYEKIGLVLGKGFFNEEALSFDKDIFASFDTHNYPEKGKIFNLKTIDESFDIITAINILLKKEKEVTKATENE